MDELEQLIKNTYTICGLYSVLGNLEYRNLKDSSEYNYYIELLKQKIQEEELLYDNIGFTPEGCEFLMGLLNKNGFDMDITFKDDISNLDKEALVRGRISNILLIHIFNLPIVSSTDEASQSYIKSKFIIDEELLLGTLYFLNNSINNVENDNIRRLLISTKRNIIFQNKNVEMGLKNLDFDGGSFYEFKIPYVQNKNIITQYIKNAAIEHIRNIIKFDSNSDEGKTYLILESAFLNSILMHLNAYEIDELNQLFHDLVDDTEYEDTMGTKEVMKCFRGIKGKKNSVKLKEWN